MNLFPLNLDIRGRKAVVVGGGAVAERKCRSLLEAGASVTVIAPVVTPGVEELLRQGRIFLLRRQYRTGDPTGALLLFAATNDRSVNRTVAGDAKRLGILVCVTDAPEEGDFASPAVVRRGELLLTISTGNRSPSLARRIRQELEGRYGPEYGSLVEFVGALREKLLTEGRDSAYTTQLFNELLQGDLSRLLNPVERERLFSIANPDPQGPLSPPDTEESP